MDDRLQQRTRYVLRTRSRRVQTCPIETFEATSAHFVHWVRAHPVLSRIVELLERERPDIQQAVQQIVVNAQAGGRRTPVTVSYSAATTREHAAICWHVVQAVSTLVGCDGQAQTHAVVSLAEFLRMGAVRLHKPDEAVEILRDVAFDSVFEFLDEQLDGRNAIYGVLLKYKQRCESFWRERLRGYAAQGLEGRSGEMALGVDLYDYILGQGVDFTVEPLVSSGKPDLVLREPEGRHLVIEAKYIPADAKPSQVKATLAGGFHQVHRYCTDFSEPSGFLVVFLETTRRLSLPLGFHDGFPAVEIGATTVYYMGISIADELPASKSGKADEIVVTPEELKLTEATIGGNGDDRNDAG